MRGFFYLLSNDYRGVAQPGLERLVRDQEAGGSNPLTPTIEPNEKYKQT